MKKYFENYFLYLVLSSGFAVVMYYAISAFSPEGVVFGSAYRMINYHHHHPIPYIITPCLIYAFLAAAFTKSFSEGSLGQRIGFTTIIVLITMAISSPLGGMIWYYHHTNGAEGFNYILTNGSKDGLMFGWKIILTSIPYNVLGVLFCHWLTAKFSTLLHPVKRVHLPT